MTTRPFDLKLRLLDRQVVDPDDALLCKVDDVEFERADDGSYHVSALLFGPLALGRRLPGRLGRWTVAVARRLSPQHDPQPRRIPFARVTGLGSSVTVDRSRDQLDFPALEAWVRDHVVDRLPGSRHESE